MVTQHAAYRNQAARPLVVSDRDGALDLLENGLREVPVYRWLIGDDAPADAYRWYGEVLLVECMNGLQGIFDDTGNLTAVIAVSESSEEAGVVDGELKDRTRRWVQRIDGFVDRFRELQSKTDEAKVADEAIRVIFALVHPERRGGGTLAALVDPVVERARRLGMPVTASTSDPRLSELYARKWNCLVRAEFTLTDGPTVWVQRLDP
ncbi:MULTISPECIES: hypothetical protein [Gordonia]|uniref:N-acetyltransferase domain-containing protein n=2 Tax=Gordonia alkanivorans TaxID=84096 RepID=F9VSS0_9ACTN|nr:MULTISPECIES: hypothetical protein [Gordonia]ETA06086.1 hypothetical protein V525_14875 [Gordonia alkanivorans CGMCC 6845]MCZ4651781.1 hypothetical protein [Gordonia amicalis]MDJ0455073.1 hypothetical protein [Gordonia amicalis]MDV7078857.1 hypothetical protein [Gordonia amicalis]UKO93578.1 hypothetical protein IHQ52_09925 [Gordonia amicalis]